MIAKLTETMASIEGEALRPVTWVVLEEVKSGQWGVGGNGLTTDDVKALQQLAGHLPLFAPAIGSRCQWLRSVLTC